MGKFVTTSLVFFLLATVVTHSRAQEARTPKKAFPENSWKPPNSSWIPAKKDGIAMQIYRAVTSFLKGSPSSQKILKKHFPPHEPDLVEPQSGPDSSVHEGVKPVSYDEPEVPRHVPSPRPYPTPRPYPSRRPYPTPDHGPYPIPTYPSPPKHFDQDEGLSGEGSLEIYNNFNWTVEAGTAEEDLQLLENWNNTQSRILDLVLIMDCTGSMSAWIEHSKTTLKTVIDDIVRGNEAVKVRVAFVGFRDFSDDNIFVIKDFTFDINEVKSFISQQRATGGGDLPEDVVGALHQTLQLSWYPGSVRLATVIADAPTHEKSPAGLVLEEVVKELRRKEVALTLYKLEDSTEAMYNVIEETINDENWVNFVDIRKEIQENEDKGLSLNSEYLAESYGYSSGVALQQAYSVQSALKGWY